MLYERWRQIVRMNRGATALVEATTGRRWTFAELDTATGRARAGRGPLCFPQGGGAEFVIATLAGWREGLPVCPLEPGQTPPAFTGPPRACAHAKLTSATTGASKAVLFSAAQLAADVDQIVPTMGLRPDWPNLGVISLAHSYGFSNLVMPLLLHGIPLILADSPLPEAVRRASALAKHLTLAAVPALWRTWHEARSIPAHVRLALSAGAPLPLLLEQQVFEAAGLKIHNFYGASECGGIAYDRTDAPRGNASCVGTPLEGVQVTVADDGCLEVRSGAVGETYWPLPERELQPGRFHSSDLAEVRAGSVFLRGRVTDLINVAGRKIAPEVIEHALAEHPQVRACLAFGIPSAGPERSEDTVMLVSTHGSVEVPALQQFLQARLPAWQVPREWRVVEGLTANRRGKLARAEWRARFLRNGLAEKSS